MFEFEANVQSVTRLTEYLRNLLESDGFLQSVWVRGEISNLTKASSGHWYFTLKDAGAQLRCVMWRSSVARMSFVPREGDEIEARGRITIYDQRGEYQLVAERLRPVGTGDLYARFEALKARLEAEGLFDAERKRTIPTFPLRIGVVTSPDAAAFQDILNVLGRRFPLAELVLSPTPVQGTDAPPQIIAALERMNRYGQVDVILLCRGGGSIEDLWCFNDEGVARAVAASSIPVITGVGHETDFTIVDFVSDLRAPTPSAAAEVATPFSVEKLAEMLRGADMQLEGALLYRLNAMRDDLATTRRTLSYVSPQKKIDMLRQRIDTLNDRMASRLESRVGLLRERVAGRVAALSAADPRAILARGYAIVRRGEDGTRLYSAADAQYGQRLMIQLHDGEIDVTVE